LIALIEEAEKLWPHNSSVIAFESRHADFTGFFFEPDA